MRTVPPLYTLSAARTPFITLPDEMDEVLVGRPETGRIGTDAEPYASPE